LALVLPLRLGIVTYLLSKWSLSEYLRAVDTYAITDIPVCPPIVGALAQLPESDRHRLRSLRTVVSAGAALPATIQNQLYDVLARQAVATQVWGTTEGGWHTHGDISQKDYSGSIGRLMPNVQLKLVSEEGDLVTEDDRPGEAFIKTSTLFSGYHENNQANGADLDQDGFYRTGDQLFIRGGDLYYTDRTKETMKVKGWQVSPTELEGVLLQHPQIEDAAVVGVNRVNMLGIPETYPTAYVVRRNGGKGPALHEQEVKHFVAARVISYKRITGNVIFIKQVPRSAAGKILRRYLRKAERDSLNGSSSEAVEEPEKSKGSREGR
jgi:acyl-coenzyme A synthetase/AMP-(fatty) acid ligase